MRISDWSSDVCSSDLRHVGENDRGTKRLIGAARDLDGVAAGRQPTGAETEDLVLHLVEEDQVAARRSNQDQFLRRIDRGAFPRSLAHRKAFDDLGLELSERARLPQRAATKYEGVHRIEDQPLWRQAPFVALERHGSASSGGASMRRSVIGRGTRTGVVSRRTKR